MKLTYWRIVHTVYACVYKYKFYTFHYVCVLIKEWKKKE